MGFRKINVIRKLYDPENFLRDHCKGSPAVLNVGSAATRFGSKCTNIDIQSKTGVDVIADAHNLPFRDGTFDVVLLCAVLQYCGDPRQVSCEAFRVLIPNGLIYVDAPFVQPCCYDTEDLFRFTDRGLVSIFDKKFDVLECSPSIPGGSALAFYCQSLIGNTGNRYIDFILKAVISVLLLPLSVIKYARKPETAGAFYLIARKPA